jgi:DHA3 family tetracycline resistance protein-like MFS transporter
MMASVAITFQAIEANLSPLQLVLVGTVLEATIFFCEVPTGVVADVFSRRLSVIIGFVIIGVGVMLSGASAAFFPILLGSIVWGLGFTFISGARQAWIADEVGVQEAGRVYLRAAQFELFARVAAILIAVVIATQDLNLPILIAGALYIVLALVLLVVMPEHSFQRSTATDRPWTSMAGTFRAGRGALLASPLLMTLFGIALFYGMSSEGFDRLWEAHFLRDIGFPQSPTRWEFAGLALDFEPVVWFGAIRIGVTVISIGATEVANRRIDLNNERDVSRMLFLINIAQLLSVLLLAFAVNFWVGVAAFSTAVALSRVYDPLYLAWVNQHIKSDVRATVLSMKSQADSLGQIAGGPPIGLVASLATIRAALAVTAMALVPALLLYLRAFRLGEKSHEELGADSPVEAEV